MVAVLDEKFGKQFGLQFSIGGQISIDVFPKGSLTLVHHRLSTLSVQLVIRMGQNLLFAARK